MQTVGVICEYNPLHLGHQQQLNAIRSAFGSGTAIVCAMSGNFVQRGAPAIVDKSLRGEAAIRCGADLVVELPIPTALSSAEGFALGGVQTLSPLCDTLCFGTETADLPALQAAAQALLSPNFPPALRRHLSKGLSFPAARQAALADLGIPGDVLTSPNNLLGVEYCKAILSSGSALVPFPIHRPGQYHAQDPDPLAPSAAALRRWKQSGRDWLPFLPEPARSLFAQAPLHTLEAGERGILLRLRTMTDAEFALLPGGSEGLWRKLMHASRQEATLEDILTAVKSKRYTRTRLDRMVMYALLGISKEDLERSIPYTRVLAFNHRGREILREAKKQGCFLNPGEKIDHPYWDLEQRSGDLYGLFCVDGPEPPGVEARRRVRYLQTDRQP